MSKLIIGLTGGIASGKTTVSEMFQLLGVDIIDADIIAREVVTPPSIALNAIASHFGDDYIQVDGQLNRPLLRQKVFRNNIDKEWLNNLLHPLIRARIVEQTVKATSNYCLLVAPLLIENNLLPLVDRLIVIDVLEASQIERTMKRDNSTLTEVKAILASQTTRAHRLNIADDIIDNNNSTLLSLNKRVSELHQLFLNLTKID
jgi:dephospho-CoA kinase